MRATILLVTFIAAVLLSAASLAAQTPLTLEQARGSALARSATLRKALLAVDSSLLAERLQGYAMLPTISASAGARASYPAPALEAAFSATAGLSVTQTIYDGGKASLLSAMDSLATKIAREEARTERLNVLRKVDIAFYNMEEARASLDAARKDLEAAQTHLRLAEAKLQAAMIARAAYLEAESEAAAKETSLIQAQGKLSVAEATLASLTGLSLPFAVAKFDFQSIEGLMEKMAGLTAEKAQAVIAAVRKEGLSNNPSLAKTALASQKAKKAANLAAADYLPSIGASFSHTFRASVAPASDPWGGSLTVSASIPLNLWTTKTNVEAGDVASRQADLDGEETLRAFALEVQGAVYDAISSARAAISARKAQQYAESRYQNVLEMYNLSSASTSDLGDAEALVSTNRTALITARFSFLSRLSDLRTLAGYENDGLLAAIIP